MKKRPDKRPPLHTELVELTGWPLDRTASFPRSHRHTFGCRLDNLCLDAIEDVTRARYAPKAETAAPLDALNLRLELMRVLWRLVEERGWIAPRQLFHVNGRIDTAGRMAGAWRKALGPGA
ncbi:MAG: four helix bundle protein [Akkermansiaceae bacterium]|nr:four helix bundle protein [Akkermansiaceae bacterium]MCP5551135.1 four helix bundle protein [Akkermansiaceae bacterium]